MILKFEKPLSPEEKRRVAEIVKHFYPDYVPDLGDFIGVLDMNEVVIPESSHALCKILLENLNSANIDAIIVREKRHDDGILIQTNKAGIQHDLRITLEEYNWLSEQRGKYSEKYDHAKKDLGINHTTSMVTEYGVIFHSIVEKFVGGKINIQRIEELITVHYDFLDAMNEVRLSEEKKSEDEEVEQSASLEINSLEDFISKLRDLTDKLHESVQKLSTRM